MQVSHKIIFDFVLDSYLSDADTSISIDYTPPTNTSSGRIAARWSTTLPGDNTTDVDFSVSAAVQSAVLDIIVVVPPEIEDLAITRGLMGKSYTETNNTIFHSLGTQAPFESYS